MIFRAFLIWLLVAAAETVHGILRVRFLNRRVGDHRARQIAVFSGSTIVLMIAWLSVPWIGAVNTPELLTVGALWLVLMLGFDVAVGRREPDCGGLRPAPWQPPGIRDADSVRGALAR